MRRNQLLAHSIALLLVGLVPTTAAAQDPPSEETIAFFKANCISCHTIGGGKMTGPDLKDVTQRQERAWLVDFMVDPKAKIDSGDPYALELLRAARNQFMTQNIPGLDKARAAKLLDLIEAESALEESQFKGTQIPTRPLTQVDVDQGESFFRGYTAFKNGAPACSSCHTVNGMGGLGGGRLGPDLTSVYGRLEGRQAMGAWLVSPPGLTMQPLFKDHALDAEEILALVAFFKDRAESGKADSRDQSLEFTLAGIALAAGLLVTLDLVFRRRFRAVRRPLVAQS